MLSFTTHKSGIKICKEFVHPDDLTEGFIEEHSLKEGDVFFVSGTPYRVEEEFGSAFACKIEAVGLSEWVLGGATHPKVQWHGTYATYKDGDSIQDLVLVPYKEKTYFCHRYTGEVIDSVDGECAEYQRTSSSSEYSGYAGIGSWSDKGYF